ncbi:hypothetical protein ACIBI8_03590 [Streptomyces sp. NPDC050529]|uniref:hypothetical protein n=1 Tax=unclassified Streptomyces TaxID=2593676 RepID=UPI002DD8D0E9|nr:hypothetical protein [Streptomyces sp. NBC_01022]WRZ83614.1 hypothetical protein OG316_26890 [Streptomyces sp. NBC_01022]
MASASPASQLVAAAARTRLRPLGVRRRGQSRLWLDDHGWWLGLVEFPSPSWSQGSGLHVGAMWLWQDFDNFAFNISEQLSGSQDYRSDQQFSPVAADLALRAQTHVQKLRNQFPDLESVASHLAAQPVRRGWFWELWNAGVAAALVGDAPLARQRFDAVLAEDPIAPWMDDAQRTTRELLATVQDRDAMRAWALSRIASCRHKLRLPPEPLAKSF